MLLYGMLAWPGSNITDAGKGETLRESKPSLNATSAHSQGSLGPINFAPSQRTDEIKIHVGNGYRPLKRQKLPINLFSYGLLYKGRKGA
jgi:hypothetical protein